MASYHYASVLATQSVIGGRVSDATAIAMIGSASTTINDRSTVIVSRLTFVVAPGKTCARLFSNVIGG
jgi:hypothetical protein